MTDRIARLENAGQENDTLILLFSSSADFQENYNARGCQSADNVTLRSAGVGATVTPGYPGGVADDGDTVGPTWTSSDALMNECLRETSLLYLLLMLGTAWLGLSLYNFTKTYVIGVFFRNVCWQKKPQSLESHLP